MQASLDPLSVASGRSTGGWKAALAGTILLILALGPASQAPAYGSGPATSTGRQRPPPSARTIDNLVAYTRLLGYVRYFHPSDAAAATDWDLFAVRTIQSVEGAGDAQTLARTLQALFEPYAPTLRVFLTGQDPPPLPGGLIPPAGAGVSVTQWRYTDFGIVGAGTPAATERVSSAFTGGQIPAGFADPRQPSLADLGGGVSALIPIALFADKGGTQLALPGVYAVSWTGNRDLKTDGSQLMHVGVLPTVPAERTIKGVIAGRDEVLNRGIQVLKQEIARRA